MALRPYMRKPSLLISHLSPNNMFDRLKREDHDEIAFRVLLGFLIGFIPMRAYLFFEYTGILPKSYIIIGDLHIHHFVFGITVLAIVGYAALVAPYFRRKIAWIYGIGLALAFDEFSMWLHLEDDYWTRASITAIILISGVLINTIYFKRFWIKIWHSSRFINPFYPVYQLMYRRIEDARGQAIIKMSEQLNKINNIK